MGTGIRVRALREAQGWTQQELAEAARIDLRTVQRLEAGHSVSRHTHRAVAGALGVGIEDLKETEEPKPARTVQQPSGQFLPRLNTGTDIVAVIASAYAYSFDHDELLDSTEVDLVAGFLQNLNDYGDIWAEMEAGGRVHATYELQEQLRELEQHGFWAFGTNVTRQVRMRSLEPFTWPVAIVRIVRSSSAEIIRVRSKEQVFQPSGETPRPSEQLSGDKAPEPFVEQMELRL